MHIKRKEREQYIFGMLFLFANQLQAIEDRKGKEITLKQWFLLAIIHKMENESLTVNMIADFMGYTRQNTKKMLDILEKKGFVQIKKSITDSRALNVSLTEKCIGYFSKTEVRGNVFLDKVFSGVDDRHIDTMYEAFQIMFETISQMNDSGKK